MLEAETSRTPRVKTILILTDQPDRGRRLVGHLEAFGHPVVIDLLDPETLTARYEASEVGAVVADASLAHSQQLAALRAHLGRLRPRRPPFLCVLHEDTARSQVQAKALGASATLGAGQVSRRIASAFGTMTRVAAVSSPITDAVIEADEALNRIFDLGRSGAALKPSVIEKGAEIVLGAIAKADIGTWLDLVWRFDDMTHQHCLLVAGLAAGFAGQLGLRDEDRRRVTEAALLHDLGKSRIPLAILNKPDRLDADEMAVMRTHPVLGFDMLRDQGHSDPMLAVVRSHHEALDGSGYPDNLRGDRIPDLVRLITVCDVFGALIERRAYKPPLGGEEAFAILRAMEGKVDPDLVRAFQPVAEAMGASSAIPTPVRVGVPQRLPFASPAVPS